MRGNDITRLCLFIIGAILCALHQAERGEIAGHVQRPAGAAPGHVPRSPGECARQEGWVRLQDGLHTLPQEVRVQTHWCQVREGWVRLQDGLHTLPEEVSVQTHWCQVREGWVRLQDGLHTLPEEVSVQTQWFNGHDQVIFNTGFFKNRF